MKNVDKLCARVPHTGTRKMFISTCLRKHVIRELHKKFTARLDTHGLPHPCKNFGVGADSPTGIQTIWWRSDSSLSTGAAYARVFKSPPPPQVNIQRIQMCRACTPCSVSLYTHPSVMIVLLRTSGTAWRTMMHVLAPHLCYDCQWCI
jgi:hypothetical protein